MPSGIPDFRTPGEGIWANVDPFEVASIDAFRRDPKRFWDFYRPRFSMLGDKRAERRPRGAGELERRGLLDAVITQNIDRLHRAAGTRELIEVHGSIATSSCVTCGRSYGLERGRRAVRRPRDRGLRRLPRARSSPTSSCSARCCRSRRSSAPASSPRAADLMICVGSSLEVFPVAGLPELTLAHGGERGAGHDQGRRPTTATPRSSSTATWPTSCPPSWPPSASSAALQPSAALADRRSRPPRRAASERLAVGRGAVEHVPARGGAPRRPRPRRSLPLARHRPQRGVEAERGRGEPAGVEVAAGADDQVLVRPDRPRDRRAPPRPAPGAAAPRSRAGRASAGRARRARSRPASDRRRPRRRCRSRSGPRPPGAASTSAHVGVAGGGPVGVEEPVELRRRLAGEACSRGRGRRRPRCSQRCGRLLVAERPRPDQRRPGERERRGAGRLGERLRLAAAQPRGRRGARRGSSARGRRARRRRRPRGGSGSGRRRGRACRRRSSWANGSSGGAARAAPRSVTRRGGRCSPCRPSWRAARTSTA